MIFRVVIKKIVYVECDSETDVEDCVFGCDTISESEEIISCTEAEGYDYE